MFPTVDERINNHGLNSKAAMKGSKSTKQYARKCKNAAAQALEWCSSRSAIPKDVPKGHFVVYVGEEWKRFVVEIALLKHPLFEILLDSAKEMFGFVNGSSRLYLPCEECVFVTTLQCIHSYRNSPSLEVL